MANRGELIEPHIPSLRRYARSLVGDRDQADDLVQDCLERALSRWHLWQRDREIRPWLFTILHNAYVSEWRRQSRRPTVPLTEATLDVLEQPGHADDRIELQQLLAAVDALPDEQREVVLLVSVESFSYEEAAKMLGVPTGTIMSRLSRARARLRAFARGEQAAPLRSVK